MDYRKILNQVPEDYYERGTRTNLLQFMWHSWKWITLKKMFSGVEGNILDIGCADGNLTGKIKSEFPKAKVTGVDMYEKSLDFARKNHPNIEFISADARKLPFKNGQFDVIVAVEVLEHIPQNERAVREVYRCLAKNGRFIVVQDTDNFLFNFIWFFWTKWKGKVWDNSHISCMKPNGLAALLRKNGFKIEKKQFSHFGMEVAFSTVKK